MAPNPSTSGLATGWFSRAVLSGFIATMVMFVAMVVAYGVALLFAVAVPEGGDTVSRVTMSHWLYGLTHNRVVDLTQNTLYLSIGAHFFIGLLWATVYAAAIEPRLWGPGWARGTVFSLLPWLLSLVVFFPVTGGGFLGLDLGAGPLPILGNLLLHLVYGATLGLIYGPFGDVLYGAEGAEAPENFQAMAGSEQMAAKGVLGGLLAGILVGMLGGFVTQPQQGPTFFGPAHLTFLLGSTLMGGALGALVGSLFGLPTPESTGHR